MMGLHGWASRFLDIGLGTEVKQLVCFTGIGLITVQISTSGVA
jgi:hypothetical protein